MAALMLMALVSTHISAVAASPTATTTTLAIQQALPVAAATPIDLTATVKHDTNQVVTPGPVLFCDGVSTATLCTGMHLLGTAQLDAAGTAKLKYIPRLGTQSVYAVYVGTATYASSASPASTVTVNQGQVTVSLAPPTGNAGNYSLTATVAGEGSRTAPGGKAAIHDLSAGAQIGSAQLAASGAPQLSFGTGNVESTQQLVTTAQAVGDFNNDGRMDVAVISIGSRTGQFVDVFLGDGKGGVTHQLPPLDIGIRPGGTGAPTAFDLYDIQVGHFDADANLDLVVSYGVSQKVAVLQGHGDGTFAAPHFATDLPQYTPDSPVYAGMSVGDFNRDGHQDVAVGTNSGKTLVILKGNSDLSLAKAKEITVGTATPYDLTTGYFDADEFLDIAFTDAALAAKVYSYLGDATGTFNFTLKASYSTGFGSIGLHAADLNGDGKVDLVVANPGSVALPPDVSLLTGKNDGTFNAPTPVVAPWQYPADVAIGDFDADGKPDLVAADYNANAAFFLKGDGAGVFTYVAPPLPMTAPNAVAAADFTSDGIPDVVAPLYNDNSVVIVPTRLATAAQGTASAVAALGAPPPAPDHYVNAGYPGDTLYAAGTSGNQELEADKLPTTLVLTPPAAGLAEGQDVTLTATLTPFQYPASIANPAYTTDHAGVEFFNGADSLGTGQLIRGTATLTKQLKADTYNLKAKYYGDNYFAASDSGAVIPYTVLPPPPGTLTTLTITGAGTLAKLAAKVVVNDDGQEPVKEGTVNFCTALMAYCTGSSLLGTAQLDQTGTATLDAYLTAEGTNYFVAVFDGTTHYIGSRSTPQHGAGKVQKATTTATLTDDGAANPNTHLTATVSSVKAGNPTGLVQIWNKTTNTYATTLPLTGSTGYPTLALTDNPITQGGTGPTFIALGDFNKDHHLDLAIANAANTLTLWQGSGTGTFTAFAPTPSLSPTAPSSIVVADFNNDGVPDLAVAQNSSGKGVLPYQGTGVSGGFTVKTEATDITQPSAIAVGDFNNDGMLDLAVASRQSNTVGTLLGDVATWQFKKPAGSSPVVLTGKGPQAIAVADFDQDGYQDVAVANVTAKSISLLRGSKQGIVAAFAEQPLTNARVPQGMVVGDFNADGLPDLATANSDGTVSVLIGQAKTHMAFTQTDVTVTGANNLSSIATGDFNADGIQDLAVSDAGTGKLIALLLNDGTGAFPPAQQHATPATVATGAVAVGDFNEDGEPDVIAANVSGTGASLRMASLTLTGRSATTPPFAVGSLPGGNTVFEAEYLGDDSFLSSTAPHTLSVGMVNTTTTLSPPGGPRRLPFTATATVTPAGATGTVTFTTDPPGPAIPPVPLVSGQASHLFDHGDLPRGNVTVTATYNGDGSHTGSNASQTYNIANTFFLQGTSLPDDKAEKVPAAPAGLLERTRQTAPQRESVR